MMEPYPDNRMVIGSGVFGRSLGHWEVIRAPWGHEGGAFVSGSGVLTRVTGQPVSSPFSVWRHKENWAVRLWPRRGASPELALLALWSQTVNIHICDKYMSVACKPPSLWCLRTAARTDGDLCDMPTWVIAVTISTLLGCHLCSLPFLFPSLLPATMSCSK